MLPIFKEGTKPFNMPNAISPKKDIVTIPTVTEIVLPFDPLRASARETGSAISRIGMAVSA